MEKGFPLDRVQMNGAGIPVDEAVTFPIPILADATKTPFALRKPAPFGAQFTLDLPSIQGGEVGRELCLDEALRGRLCPDNVGKTEEVSSAENGETCTANL